MCMKQKHMNIYLLVQAIYFCPLKYYSYVLFQLTTPEKVGLAVIPPVSLLTVLNFFLHWLFPVLICRVCMFDLLLALLESRSGQKVRPERRISDKWKCCSLLTDAVRWIKRGMEWIVLCIEIILNCVSTISVQLRLCHFFPLKKSKNLSVFSEFMGFALFFSSSCQYLCSVIVWDLTESVFFFFF